MAMDMQQCATCQKEFDFDVEGLQGPGGIVVCGSDCAEKSATRRGHAVAIHDHSGAVIKTNVTPSDDVRHCW